MQVADWTLKIRCSELSASTVIVTQTQDEEIRRCMEISIIAHAKQQGLRHLIDRSRAYINKQKKFIECNLLVLEIYTWHWVD